MARALGIFMAAWLWLCLHADTALAHAIGLSRGDYQLRESGLEAELVFARSDLIGALPALDENRDGNLDSLELETGAALLAEFVSSGWTVVQDGKTCLHRAKPARLTEGDGLLTQVSFHCQASSRPLSVELGFLRSMGHGHRHHAELSNGLAHSVAIYFGEHAHFGLGPFEATSRPSAATGRALEKLGYLRMGFEHILAGADHIAFLLALVLGTSRPLRLLRVVTAFTLAHSLSLALVALGWFAPSTSWVEPAIALSVAYVGVENLRSREPKQREFVSFGFGLVHGLGFGGALADVRLTPNEIPSALALFNVGVEFGQLLLVLALLPLLAWMRKTSWFAHRALPACSLALAACGVLWFAARVG